MGPSFRGKLGLLLIALGVLAWPVGLGLGTDIGYVLPVHLSLVVPGVILKGSRLAKFLAR